MLGITLPSVRPPARVGVAAFKRMLRARGWELRRTDPDRSLGEHLWFLFPYLGVNGVLDVGAGAGEYGAFLRESGYTGEIISFEPVSERFEQLARRCAADPRWRVYPFALGAENATASINVTRDPRYSSFLRPSEHAQASMDRCAIERTESVEIRRLDDVLDSLGSDLPGTRLFLHLGIWGWDLEVLRGAERRLDTIVGIQARLSLHPLHDGAAEFAEALAAFNQAGFAVSGMFDLPHHQGFRLAEVDCVMTRPSGRLDVVARRW